MKCLEVLPQREDHPDHEVQAVVFDGAAVVNYKQPGTAKTFDEYADKVFIPYISNQSKSVKRVDVVFDVYREESLKAAIRVHRGSGTRRRVCGSTPLPSDWSDFLRNDNTKTELFHFLAEKISATESPIDLIVTYDENVKSNRSELGGITFLSVCNHEEADTRMLLHTADIANKYQNVNLRTVDTDVVVLALSNYSEINIDKLWIAFGVGKHFSVLPIHDIVNTLGNDKANTLPLFHAFTGCDTVSSFNGRGKKSAWDTWNAFQELTTTLGHLSNCPASINEEDMMILERFVVMLYCRSSKLTYVNDARKQLFTQKNRTMETLPPTQASLLQHTKRAVFQGGYVWGQCLEPIQELPPHRLTGDGKRKQVDGTLCGQHFLMSPHKHRN